jgi:hypothetical protein
MRINHKLLRHARVELAVTLRRVVQADGLSAKDFSDVGMGERSGETTI